MHLKFGFSTGLSAHPVAAFQELIHTFIETLAADRATGPGVLSVDLYLGLAASTCDAELFIIQALTRLKSTCEVDMYMPEHVREMVSAGMVEKLLEEIGGRGIWQRSPGLQLL